MIMEIGHIKKKMACITAWNGQESMERIIILI